MKNRYLQLFTPILLLTLTGCHTQSSQEQRPTIISAEAEVDEWSIIHPEEKAQAQHLKQMETKLKRAQRMLAVQQKEVSRLKHTFFQEQIAFISRRIDLFEDELSSLRERPAEYQVFLQRGLSQLFSKEREALAQMIDSEEEFAKDGQRVFDKILRIITLLSDEKAQLEKHSI